MAKGPPIEGATVVVTGASSGIGRATARAAAARGANVVLAARDRTSLEEAAEECRAAGGAALAVPTDVSDPAAVEALARRARARFGRIDVWVGNAAVMVYGAFDEVPDDVHRHVVETNLGGQMYGARAVLPVFKEQGRGVLVIVGSLYDKMTSPLVSGYVTSKFGLLGFAEVLRQELMAHPDIHVCTVLPASVDTPIFRHAGNYAGRRPRPVPPVSSADRVVRAILGAIERPRAEIKVGQVGRVLSWAHTVVPSVYDRLVPHVMRVLSLQREPAGPDPGNVFTPVPAWNRVSGGWRRRRYRLLALSSAAAAAGAAGIVARSRR